MNKYLILLSALFLSACSLNNANTSNPFSSTTNVSSVYTSQFPDVPIPMDMKSEGKNTLTTISSSGDKVGRETFSGRVEHFSLGAAMAHNLKNQNWIMVGIVQGQHTLQLYQKNSRYLIITIRNSAFGSDMELWMINQVDQVFGLAQTQQVSFKSTKITQNNQVGTPPNNTIAQPFTNSTPSPASITSPSSPASSASSAGDFDSFGSESLFN